MASEERNAKRPTLLVVEDEEVLVELLKTMLEAQGFRVIIAMDGREAVEHYKEMRSEIDIVLTDMGLPKLGGWDVLAQVRALNPNARVVCASGFMDSSLRDEMIKAGAYEFVQKPYVYDHLVKLFREILQNELR